MFLSRRNTYRQLDDNQLISSYKEAGSKDAFGIIYERYGHLVMGLCLKYLKDEEEAKDLCASIFERLGAKILKHPITYFKSWLYQLTKNECLMYLRKTQVYFVPIDLMQLEAPSEDQRKIEREKQYQLLEQAINDLNEVQATCIRLFFLDDLSYLEIARQLNLNLKQVKSYIQNGKRNLKNQLINHEEFKA